MTADQFRSLALDLPETEEHAHMEHPDFRVGGKIFATLARRDGRDIAMVKLSPVEQAQAMRDEPEVFLPVNGAWGKRGATWVELGSKRAKSHMVRRVLLAAWRNTAPKRVVAEYDPGD